MGLFAGGRVLVNLGGLGGWGNAGCSQISHCWGVNPFWKMFGVRVVILNKNLGSFRSLLFSFFEVWDIEGKVSHNSYTCFSNFLFTLFSFLLIWTYLIFSYFTFDFYHLYVTHIFILLLASPPRFLFLSSTHFYIMFLPVSLIK